MPAPPAPERPEPAKGRLVRLRSRLAKSQSTMGKGLLTLLSRDRLDDDTWEEIVEASFRPVEQEIALVEWAGAAIHHLDLPVDDARARWPHTIVQIGDGYAYAFVKRFGGDLRVVVGQEDLVTDDDHTGPVDHFAELLDAVDDAMRKGLNQYPPMTGIAPLREAVAAKIEALYGRTYDPVGEITITAGATQAIITAVLAMVFLGERARFSTWLATLGVADTSALRVRHFGDANLAVQGAISGLGATLSWHSLVEDDLKAGRLVRLLDQSLPTTLGYYLAMPPNRVSVEATPSEPCVARHVPTGRDCRDDAGPGEDHAGTAHDRGTAGRGRRRAVLGRGRRLRGGGGPLLRVGHGAAAAGARRGGRSTARTASASGRGCAG